ncbi:zeta toxin family protein [Streptantibioticus rubrisoli]|uniref:D-inositol 3-phosphate glycosyltransferase n=1 Tax=Streptantibioticus rubrisoli TaxID=1387313 RepID=A0ABT1PD47_9ACTN|nr:zeta toxin family protein [Streptantibioticus rubrisoli]MCQ4043280.1 zeta toxin family protein [Streptantibioticus rubrisoli]
MAVAHAEVEVRSHRDLRACGTGPGRNPGQEPGKVVTSPETAGTAYVATDSRPVSLLTARAGTEDLRSSDLGPEVTHLEWVEGGTVLRVETRAFGPQHFRPVEEPPGPGLMGETKVRSGTTADPHLVRLARTDMLARTWLHEITDTMRELTEARKAARQGVVRGPLAPEQAQGSEQCVPARMREYMWLSRKWQEARTRGEQSHWEVELMGTARDIVARGHTPSLPPWADGPAGNASWRSRWTFQYAEQGPERWKLSDVDNELVFRWEILPQAMEGVSRPTQPQVTFIGGQAASGKTTAQRAAMEGMGPPRALIADFDAMLSYSPMYQALMRANDRTAAAQVGGDAWVWMNKVIDVARQGRLNLVREGAMGGWEGAAQDAARFRALGYRVEAHLMAVPEAISRLSILNRYQQMRDEHGYGRLVVQSIHDEAYTGIPQTVGAVDELRFLDAITIHRWGGEVMYTNSLDAQGAWREPARARQELELERARPFTDEQARWFRETYARLDATLPAELRPQLGEISELAARHGVDVAPGGELADRPGEALRQRYADAAQEVLRTAYIQEREQLLQDYQQRLAVTPPAGREAAHQEFAAQWAELARQHDAGRFSMRILAYCTEWDPHKGGIVAVNRNLVEGLAAAGHEVFVRVGHEVPPDAPGERIHLIGPRQYDPGRGEQEQLVYGGEDLPQDVDAIIGHSRYSGPEALQVRDQLYLDTPYVHVIHMVTGALARVADRPDLEVEFEGIERRMVAAADMVAGVGPVLADEARRLAATNPGDHSPAIHQITPGVPFEQQRLLPWNGERTREVLFVGRADAPQKGAHHAALMVRQLNQEGIDVQLTVRGAAPETVEQVKERLSNIVGREVVVKPFSIDRDEILADMRQADVLVMPSQAEGFGLVGLEAAGAGLPVLLPNTSGVGAFFGNPDRFPPEITRNNLVEQGFEDQVDVERWTDKLRDLLLDIPAARENALAMQQHLRQANTTWMGAAESLAAAVQAMPDRRASRPVAPALPAMAGDGWANCAHGHAHWGRFGAAGLLPFHRAEDGQVYVLMHHRGADTDQGGTWALLGGARDSHESAARAAIREAVEESTLDPAHVRVERIVRDDHGGWAYDTVLASVDQPVEVRPVEGESVALAWVPLSEVETLNLHPGFAASWPGVQAELDAVLNGEPSTVRVAPAPPTSALPLPPHPVSGAGVVAREPLEHGEGIANRELVTFADGTRAVYEKYVRPEDATTKVLDGYVGRAVGARVPLSHPVGLHELYTDHMPGEPASAHHRDLTALADRGLPATRDGVFLGLYHALTATHGVTADDLTLGERQSLIAFGDGAPTHGPLPDPANPFVRTFYRQTEPHVFAWVDNPIPPSDIAIMRRQLDGLRSVFEQLGRTDLHNVVMERFDQAAEHARGTAALLPRPPGFQVALPDPAPERHYPLPPPPGSQERIDQQRIGEALLTDDGRITSTSQAKTIAIQALAERMRSSTPELALAAFGLVVGTDMAHRLGDSRYVLVPHNEKYPSMGADVLRINELDPADPRHSPDKALRMDNPRAEALIRQIAVSELMGAWAYGSNNNVRVLALQEAAKEEFGLTRVLEWQMDPKTRAAVDLELDYNRDALQDFLRTQYDLTQEALAARGITELVAYRALTWHEGATQPTWADLDVGDAFEARHRPLASWAADRQIVADWLEQRGGHAVILVDRKPAQDILSMPTTGMGFFAQKEWVTLPGDRLVTLDGVYTGRTPAAEAEQTAASSVTIGAPVLNDAAEALANDAEGKSAAIHQEAAAQWRPVTITAQLDPADPLDNQIVRILSGDEEFPSWWPRDDSGYAITGRDLNFLGINPVQLKWMLTGEAPMGMTPELYQRFSTEMLEALRRDGIEPSQVDIRLKGTGAAFFAGTHKTLPSEEDLVGNPEAAQRLREWFGNSQDRPIRRPYDFMWRLGLEPVPSDFDLDINSTAMVRAARAHWIDHHSDRYPGDFMGGHGYLDKQAVMSAFPALAEWANRWQEDLGRPLSLGVFESSGPFDATQLGRTLSSHFQDTDWIIHSPDHPMAWRTPRPKITVGNDQAKLQRHRDDITHPPGPSTDLRHSQRPSSEEQSGTEADRPSPLARLTDTELTDHRARLTDTARRLRLHSAQAARAAEETTERLQHEIGQVVARLQAQGAAPELIERARASAQNDIDFTRKTAQKAQSNLERVIKQLNAANQEAERRTNLPPSQRENEDASRQKPIPQRKPSQQTPPPRIQGPRPEGPSRSGPSL